MHAINFKRLMEFDITTTVARQQQKIDILVDDAVRNPTKQLSATEQQHCYRLIKSKLKRHNAKIIAHYYTPPEIQQIAEETGGFVGDSLEMARFGSRTNADHLIICGVKFMGETAKILSPNKRVQVAEVDATCSLDLSCPAKEFAEFCKQHPERTVVVYANTSAKVKALSDWVVTSSIAVDVVEYLYEQGKKILWAPDRYLGQYIQKQTAADMLIWNGSCIVHEEFKADLMLEAKSIYPNAAVLVHPESPAAVIELADFVGSTSQLINAAKSMPQSQFIVATDAGIFYKMQQAVPTKELIKAPTAGEGASCRSCARCPWMQMNSLQALANCFDNSHNDITVEADVAYQAMQALERMVQFKKTEATAN